MRSFAHRATRTLALMVLCMATLASAFGCTAWASSPNLATNGSFEVGLWGAAEPLGWHTGSGAVEVVDSSTGSPYDGQDWVDLDATPSQGSIYQDIPTIPGHSYTISLAYAGNPNCEPGVKDMAVKWGGQTIDTTHFDTTNQTQANMGWVPVSYAVTGGPASTSRLELASLTAGSCGPAVDGVSVVDNSSRDPAPACAAAGNCNWDLHNDFTATVTGATPQNPFPDSYGDHNTWTLRQGGDYFGALATHYVGSDFAQGIYRFAGDNPGALSAGYPYFLTNENSTDTTVSTGTFVAHHFAVHPGPGEPAVIDWTSPIQGTIALTGGVSDDDPNGGDGVGYRVRLNGLDVSDGSIANGGGQQFNAGNVPAGVHLDHIDVNPGDTLEFIITANPVPTSTDGDYSYDSTQVDVHLQQNGGGNTIVKPVITNQGLADLSSNSATLQASINPEGHATTWHVEWAPTPTGPWTAVPGITDSAHVLDASGDSTDLSPHTVTQQIPGPGASFQPDTTYYAKWVAANGGGSTDGGVQSLHTNPVPDTTPPKASVSSTNLLGGGAGGLRPGTAIPTVAYGTAATITYSCADPNPGTNGARASGIRLCELIDNGSVLPAGAGSLVLGGPALFSRQATLPTTTPGHHALALLVRDGAGNPFSEQWSYTVAAQPTPAQQIQEAKLVVARVVSQFKPNFWQRWPNPPFPWGIPNRPLKDAAGHVIAYLWDTTPKASITTPSGGSIVEITSAQPGQQLVDYNAGGAQPVLQNMSSVWEVLDGSGRPTGIIGAGSANIIGAGSANIIAAGSANIAVISGGGIIAAGSANIVSAGSANIVAAGSANIIAAGSGNIIAAGSANVVGAGSANIIAAGSANFAGALVGGSFSSFRNAASPASSAGAISMPVSGAVGSQLSANLSIVGTLPGRASDGRAGVVRAAVAVAAGAVRFARTGESTTLGLIPSAAGRRVLSQLAAANRKRHRHHQRLTGVRLRLTVLVTTPGGKHVTRSSTVTMDPVDP